MEHEPPDTKEILRIRVERVQERYNRDSVIFRVLWIAIGATVLLAGLVMLVLPGPAIIAIPVGLAMLAAEFVWARRLLLLGIDKGVNAKRRIERASVVAKILGALALLSLGAALAAVVVLR